MRVKKVNRYYCDFCRKAGCSAGHLKRHETSCTANPNRVCNVCKMVEGVQKPIAELLAVLPKGDSAVKALRELTNNCPACILAALRQSGCAAYSSFRFVDEMASVWSEINNSNVERYV